METVTRIKSLQKLAEFKVAWEGLLMASGSDHLFLSWEWIFTWCKYRSQEKDRFLLVVTEGDLLVAIAPFVASQRSLSRMKLCNTLNFMGTDVIGSDYMDILIREGAEASAVKAISRYLHSNGMSLELSHLCSEQSNAILLVNSLAERRWNVVRSDMEVCPYIPLIGHSWESYIRSLGSSHRANVKRKIRKLNAQFSVKFETIIDDSRLVPVLNEMVMLHFKRHGDASVSDAFTEESVLSFHREIAQLQLADSRLRIYRLELDGVAVASLYGFLVSGKFYFYQSGFDPDYSQYSVGLIVLAYSIQESIKEGASEYDLLHGNERYKYLWANNERVLERVFAFSPDAVGYVAGKALAIKHWIRNLAEGLKLL